MKILRQKKFSLNYEHIRNLYETPKDLNRLPKIIQKYYKLGINKDFFHLAELQDTISEGIQVGPVPCIDLVSKDNYYSLFADDQDSVDFESPYIWYDNNGDLYKKSGIFFTKFIKITDAELKDYLKRSIIEDDEVGEAYVDHKFYQKIVSLEKQIISKINKL